MTELRGARFVDEGYKRRVRIHIAPIFSYQSA